MFLAIVSVAGVSAGLPAAQAGSSFALGAFLTNPNGSDPAAEATFEAYFHSFSDAMQNKPTMLDVYVDKTQPVSDWPSNVSWQAWSNAQSPIARNMVPVLGFPMASDASGEPSYDQQFQNFANGQYDSEIQGVVQAWKQQGFNNLIVRVGWEMNINGDTYVGDDGQSQSDWVRAFQHISNVLHQAANNAGVNLQVVWNPSATNYSNAEATKNLYPGDSYVDIIGADIYGGMFPFSDGSGTQYHDWVTGGEDYSLEDFMARPGNRMHYWSYPAATEWSQDGSNGHSQSLLSLIDFAQQHNKPFAIPETGAGNSDGGNDVSDEGTFAYWLGKTLLNAQNNGLQVAFVNIWDTNDWGNYQFSYESNGKPKERSHWQRFIGAIANQN